MLIFNLITDGEEIKKINFSDEVNLSGAILIDLPGTCYSLNCKSHLIPRTWDSENAIEIESHKALSQTVGKISNDFKLFNFDGLPLYWITNFSEKLDPFCPGINYFYFKHLVIKDKKIRSYIDNHQSIKVLIGSNGYLYAESIKQLICENFDSTKVIDFYIPKRRNKLLLYASNFANFFTLILRSSNVKNYSAEELAANGIILITSERTMSADKDLKQVYENHPNEVKYLNVGISKIDDNEISDCAVIVSIVKKNRPNFRGIFSIIWFIIVSKYSILIRKIFLKETGEKKTLHKQVLSEIDTLLYYPQIFYKYTHYKRIFESIKVKSNFIITDEFHNEGRLIVSALMAVNNPELRIYGLQHGLFGDSHTLYQFSNDELFSSNPVPKPHNFIVWGEFFKEFFLSFNDLPSNYVIVGHPAKYLKKPAYELPVNKVKMILWCTTLYDNALFELKYFLVLLSKMTIKVKVRNHPIHNIYNKLLEELNNQPQYIKDSFILDEDDLNYSMQRADLVVASNPSTIYIDAMFNQTPVIIIDNKSRILNAPPLKLKSLNVVKNIDQFIESVSNLLVTTEINDAYYNYIVDFDNYFLDSIKSTMRV